MPNKWYMFAIIASFSLHMVMRIVICRYNTLIRLVNAEHNVFYIRYFTATRCILLEWNASDVLEAVWTKIILRIRLVYAREK